MWLPSHQGTRREVRRTQEPAPAVTAVLPLLPRGALLHTHLLPGESHRVRTSHEDTVVSKARQGPGPAFLPGQREHYGSFQPAWNRLPAVRSQHL